MSDLDPAVGQDRANGHLTIAPRMVGQVEGTKYPLEILGLRRVVTDKAHSHSIVPGGFDVTS